MRLAAVPSVLASSCACHSPPRWNRILSPGWKAVAFTFATLVQAAPVEVPAFASEPPLET